MCLQPTSAHGTLHCLNDSLNAPRTYRCLRDTISDRDTIFNEVMRMRPPRTWKVVLSLETPRMAKLPTFMDACTVEVTRALCPFRATLVRVLLRR